MSPLITDELTLTTGGVDWRGMLRKFTAYGVLIDALGNIPDIREGFYDGYNNLPPRHQAG